MSSSERRRGVAPLPSPLPPPRGRWSSLGGVGEGAGGDRKVQLPWLLGFTALDKAASHTQKWRWALGLCPCHQSPWDSCWG